MTVKNKINASTKISTLIEENPKTIEVIASINKNFKKLQNPVLRRTLASRVSIRDASRIGGVSINTILRKLEEIGFEVELNNEEEELFKNNDSHRRGFGFRRRKRFGNRKYTNMKVIELDAREDLEKGIDPFQSIMKKIKTLEEGEVLRVINTFEPLPLINVLKSKGYRSWVERENGLVLTYFQKTEDSTEENLENSQNLNNSEFEATLAKYAGKLLDIDVRGLEMPEPMMTILEKIEELKEGEALYVHHERVPQYLKPELESRDFRILTYKADDNNVKLLIFK
jgi:uncharacterized protein (DUF2249 family)